MLLFEQDDKYSYANGAKDNAIEMFDSKQLPIKKAVAENFAVFNHLHGSVPSFSTPNHLFWASATSCEGGGWQAADFSSPGETRRSLVAG